VTHLPLLSRDRAGFTLIEVIGAVLFFALAVGMATQLAGSLSRQVERAALRAGVTSAAQERLEEMERLPYDSLTVGTTMDTITIRGREFASTREVTEFGTRVRSVRVSIEPVGGSGPSQELTGYVFGPW